MLFNVKHSHYLNKNNAINMLALKSSEVKSVMNMVLFDIVNSGWTLVLEGNVKNMVLGKCNTDVDVKVEAIKYRIVYDVVGECDSLYLNVKNAIVFPYIEYSIAFRFDIKKRSRINVDNWDIGVSAEKIKNMMDSDLFNNNLREMFEQYDYYFSFSLSNPDLRSYNIGGLSEGHAIEIYGVYLLGNNLYNPTCRIDSGKNEFWAKINGEIKLINSENLPNSLGTLYNSLTDIRGQLTSASDVSDDTIVSSTEPPNYRYRYSAVVPDFYRQNDPHRTVSYVTMPLDYTVTTSPITRTRTIS